MLTVRNANQRGHANHGWLDTYHSFSFGDYYDPAHMGFRSLRVINDDKVAAAHGFGMHPHRDMEIITWVLSGALQHKDSMGNGSVIRPGDMQRMTAGKGVFHSEENPSKTDETHLLQIWIVPEKRGLEPSYEEKNFTAESRRNQLRVLASRDGRNGSVTVHQDVTVSTSLLDAGARIEVPIAPGRHLWIQVAKGSVRVNGALLIVGDGAALSNETLAGIEGIKDSEILVFDLN
ncbi:pirin family protein [Candidatus Sumerlaeota bacterium]|nr:pirin family protein [Candidatus Sumerlaeota bacterium]